MKTSLRVDGGEVELGEFARNIFSEKVLATVTSLKGIKEVWNEIAITI